MKTIYSEIMNSIEALLDINRAALINAGGILLPVFTVMQS